MTNWSVDLGDGDLALVRYTFTSTPSAPTPDVDGARPQARRDGARLGAERRGGARPSWSATGRATRLDHDLRRRLSRRLSRPLPGRGRGRGHPPARRARGRPRSASVRLYRLDDRSREPAPAEDLPRRAGWSPLSDVVPVLENFGFRVLKETPTRLEGASEGHIHEFAVADRRRIGRRRRSWRAPR